MKEFGRLGPRAMARRVNRSLGRLVDGRRRARPALSLEGLEPRQVMAGDPAISEFMALNNSLVTDEDGAFSDWIEVRNTTGMPLDLAGYYLTDNAQVLNKWQLPATTLAHGQHVVVWASGKDRLGTGALGQLHTNFSLGGDGEFLALVRPDGTTIVQQFESDGGGYPQQYGDISYGLMPVTSEEVYFLAPTPGTANNGPTSTNPAQAIVINEIMYHPSSENDADEWIELFNAGGLSVSMDGWAVEGGADFDFAAGTQMSPGGYLIVAANRAQFLANHPTVNPASVVGGWTGNLSNRYEEIRLENSFGDRIDTVDYAEEGDWADRVQTPPDGAGYRSWIWDAPHDGGGRTVELVNAQMPNNQGQNWRPSTSAGGTPGAQNSVAAANIAPLVGDVGHFPLIPRSSEAVTITADVRDELTTGLVVNARWRVDRANNTDPFQTAPMFDDGAHGDGLAGDGQYGATIPAQANNAIVEYYVSATDSGARTRTWPGPTEAGGVQGANALYQVDDAFTANWQSGNQIMFRLIMTEDERADLRAIQQAGGVNGSDAQMNGTFISYDGEGLDARYRVSIRNRGGTTRQANGTAANYHIAFPHDDTWNDRSAATINYNFTYNQVLAATMFQAAGNPAEDATPIQLRVNNANLAQTGNRMYGSYAWLETRGNDFVNNHFPNDSAGNLYAVNDDDGPPGNFDYRGEDAGPTGPYADSYHKQTNEELADWSDIVHISDVLTNTPAEDIFLTASTVANLEEWARHFAVDTLLVNREGGLVTGRGDDYSLYSGVTDPRFYLIPHDLDTVMGASDFGGFNPNVDIHAGYSQVSGLQDVFNDPQFLRLYHDTLLSLLNGVFSATSINAQMDQIFTGWLPQTAIDTLKSNAALRRSYVTGVLPTSLTVASTLGVLGGYPRTTNNTVNLSGTAHAGKTVSVTVNGVAATWNARTANWSLGALALNPGINRLYVRAWDGLNGMGNLVAETFIDVWNDQAGQALTGTISTNRTLTAAAGPYHVTGSVTVAPGATLTIQPGTSLFFSEGAQLTVNGRLVAEGNANNWIRFTREPNTTANWGGIQFSNTTQDNRISYAAMEWSTTNQGMVGLDGSNLTIDHAYLDHAERRRVRSQNSSLVIRNSTFAEMFAPGVPPLTDNFSEHIWGGGIPDGGHWIVENNLFGLLKGHNDGIDFDAPPGVGAIPAQILNNAFLGSGDDFSDMTGNAYLEGNRFLNAHRDQYNMDPGQSNVNSSSNGDYTSVRNVYYNIDHATLTKETAFTTFENNTVVGADFSAIYFDLAGQTSGPGRGAAIDGSIFYDSPILFSDVIPTTQLSLNRSIVPTAADAALGVGNLITDPNFTNLAGLDFTLGPGSPARGTGPNGIDRGAFVAAGATIGGEPAATTPLTTATLTVDGPGLISYRHRLNTGAYSAETPITTPISLTGLTNGTYTVHVIGKNAAGVWQAEANATASQSWTVQTSGTLPIQVVINEVLASNAGAVALGATRPDVIELYNRGDAAVNLAGLGITDNPNLPAKYVFPGGTTIPARGYLLLYADSLPSQAGELHLGFGLDAEADRVFLFPAGATPATTPLDSVQFGIQLPNLSIGRLPDGTGTATGTFWGLAQPTLGSANRSQPLGNPSQLKINEWFTSGSYTVDGQVFTDDFIELCNPQSLPVAVGGLYLSDRPADDPADSPIPALSYVQGGSHSVFYADGNTDSGANHVGFQLASERGWIGLMDSDLSVIDQVFYMGQTANVSQGRSPDCTGTAFSYFNQPSPGLDSSPPNVPQNFRATFVSDTRIDLAWDASADPQTGVDHYVVYRNGAVLADNLTSTTFSDTSVVAGTSYQYEVAAVNGDGFESARSTKVIIGTDSSPPTVPTNLMGAVATRTRIDLTWTASADPQRGVDHYTIYRNGTQIGTSTTPTFADTSAPTGAAFYYEVSASNSETLESGRSVRLNVAQFQDGVTPSGGYNGTTDTWIHENPTNQNQINGGGPNMRVDGADPMGQQFDIYGLMRWDVSTVPAGTTVVGAAMTLGVTNGTGGTYGIFPLLHGWDESQVNWINSASGVPWGQAGASGAADRGTTLLGTITGGPGFGGQPVDVTLALNGDGLTRVGAWLADSNQNYGVIFADTANTDGIDFLSSDNATIASRPRLTIFYRTPDTTPPKVSHVKVLGSQWSAAMRSRLTADGLGVGGYTIPIEAGPNFTPLPWTNLNRVQVTFTEDVNVTSNHLAIRGVNNATYTTTGFAYDSASRTATWSLPAAFPADKLRFVLDDAVTDLAGNALDGEIGAAYPSGNNTAGGDLSLRLDVLPGDSDLDRGVDRDDFHAIRQSAFDSAAAATYRPRRDLDGNGAVNVQDLHAALLAGGSTLPAGNPAGSPEPSGSPAPSAAIASATVGYGNSRSSSATLPLGAVRRSSVHHFSPAHVDQLLTEADSGYLQSNRTGIRLRASRRTIE